MLSRFLLKADVFPLPHPHHHCLDFYILCCFLSAQNIRHYHVFVSEIKNYQFPHKISDFYASGKNLTDAEE